MAFAFEQIRARYNSGKAFAAVLLGALFVAPIPLAKGQGSQDPQGVIRGVTISCQTWGWEWGTPEFDTELSDLSDLGVNWVAIHPYARIAEDGSVKWRAFDPKAPPQWLLGPIRDAHARGMDILIKPHLAYWGSPFAWRGDINFEASETLSRFWTSYRAWIVALAEVTHAADAFAVGTELDSMLSGENEAQWRELIASVRAVSDAKLTYAANWSDFDRVPFWDALDAIGVQAYFPLVVPGGEVAPDEFPSEETLRQGWQPILTRLHSLHDQVGKPVVFTELGYDVSPWAALEPWKDGRPKGPQRAPAEALQERCLGVALNVLREQESWLRGAFLWKWFVGEPRRGDSSFYVDHPRLRAILRECWTE